MDPAEPDFRPGGVLATRFTGTLSERLGEPLERLPTPQRLMDWLAANGLAVGRCTTEHLTQARALREAIHAVLTAAATGQRLPSSELRAVNRCSAAGRAASSLTMDGARQWRLQRGTETTDALGVIAADAIEIAAGERDGRLAQCASATCRAVFLDTSQSRTRRWCDMNTCGNKQKKARMRGASTL